MVDSIGTDYLDDLAKFLDSVNWIFKDLNTKYLKGDFTKNENRNLLNSDCFHQHLAAQVDKFNIAYETIHTEAWQPRPIKKIKVKKLYEIENVSKVLSEICGKNEVIVDFGSGIGYFPLFLHENYGYKIIGLESCENRVQSANARLEKSLPKAAAQRAVKYCHHFITPDSDEFILNQLDDSESPIAIFGLHGCGDVIEKIHSISSLLDFTILPVNSDSYPAFPENQPVSASDLPALLLPQDVNEKRWRFQFIST